MTFFYITYLYCVQGQVKQILFIYSEYKCRNANCVCNNAIFNCTFYHHVFLIFCKIIEIDLLHVIERILIMKISCLSENTYCFPDYEKENGLSILISTEDEKILFDFGAKDIFLKNAKKTWF